MTILNRLLRHDAATTRSLLELSSGLSDAELNREFDIGHKSLRRTFTHIVANMECWCDLMSGREQREVLRRQSPFSIRELIERLDIVAAENVLLGDRVDRENLADEYFVDYLDDPPTNKPLGAGLVHIATHGMHHRAQCLYIMRMLGVKNLIEGDAIGWEMMDRGLKEWPRA